VVSYLDNGRLLFSISEPDAKQVELFGAFVGWERRSYPMERSADGTWRAVLDIGPGEYLFRYLIDGRRWKLDTKAHGIVRNADGRLVSRVYCPPLQLSADELAA
jgi:1,4-alpha-glucan branching enzyme